MVSGPLDLTNDPWIKSQVSHCKKGIDVGVHAFGRTKMAEKSSLLLPSPSQKCLSKGEALLQGKEVMGSNVHSAASSPVFCAASISWSRLEKGKELLEFSSKAWWRAGHGLSAGLGQPSFVMPSADPEIGTLLMNTEPMWTHLFCRCKNVWVYLGQAAWRQWISLVSTSRKHSVGNFRAQGKWGWRCCFHRLLK